MTGRFVTFHGIDGTGKTTAVESLVSKLEGLDVPTTNVDSLATDSGEPVDPRELNLFDVAAQASIEKKFHQSDAIRIALADGKSIVKDRWAIDVYANHAYKGDVLPNSVPTRIVRPNLAVILTCAEWDRQRRIAQRGNPTEEDLVPNISGTRAHFFEQYLMARMSDFALRTVQVDTTNLLPEEIATIVAEEMER